MFTKEIKSPEKGVSKLEHFYAVATKYEVSGKNKLSVTKIEELESTTYTRILIVVFESTITYTHTSIALSKINIGEKGIDLLILILGPNNSIYTSSDCRGEEESIII